MSRTTDLIAAAQQQLTGEFWNGMRWNGVLTDETALSDDAIDAFLAGIKLAA
jgi:hypothetical protein